jgi:uncharacterized protein YndB with AHSA1/START domain
VEGGVSWLIESVRDAAVDPAAVWRLYTDPSTWPLWGHNAKGAHAEGPLVEGGTVEVKAGYGKVYRCRIRRLIEGRSIEFEVRPPLIKVIQTYEVDPTPEGSHIRHAIEISGPLSGLMRLLRVNQVYQGWLNKEVDKLIAMARDDPGSADRGSLPGREAEGQ